MRGSFRFGTRDISINFHQSSLKLHTPGFSQGSHFIYTLDVVHVHSVESYPSAYPIRTFIQYENIYSLATHGACVVLAQCNCCIMYIVKHTLSKHIQFADLHSTFVSVELHHFKYKKKNKKIMEEIQHSIVQYSY